MTALIGTVQLRKGISSQWSTANPTLLAGELGYDSTLGIVQMGNGATAWNSFSRKFSFGLIPDEPGAIPYIDTDGRLTTSIFNQSSDVVSVAAGGKLLNDAGQAGFEFVSGSLDTNLKGNLVAEEYSSALRTSAIGGFTLGYGDDPDLSASSDYSTAKFSKYVLILSNSVSSVRSAISVSGGGGVQITKTSGGGAITNLSVATGTIELQSSESGFVGATYADDYSPNYVDRSIPDVGYVNGFVSAILGGYVPLYGGTLSGPLLYSGTPTLDSELINKAYVDNLVNGIDYKDNVYAATTANITLSGIQTIDGQTGAANKRILVKNQTTQTENGLYLMKSGAWTRTTDGDTGLKLEWAVVAVSNGSTNANKLFRCNLTGITLGSTNIVFSEWTASTYTAGSYLALSGSTFDIDFSTFSTTQITEGSKLFHTTSRARSAISGTGVISYDNSTGVIGMAAATGSVNGYLSSTDWTTFNGKESALTFSTGLTRTSNTITNNLLVGVSGGQTIVGGTGVGDTITYKATTGNGTSTVAAHSFVVGNNGGTTALNILNNGNVKVVIGYVGIGTDAVTSQPITSSFSLNGQLISRFINSNGSGAAISSLATQNNSAQSQSSNKLGSAYTTAGLLTASLNWYHGNVGNTLFSNSSSGSSFIWSIAGIAAANEVMRASEVGLAISGGASAKITSPTAYLHLAAGEAAASRAPLKFTTGTNQTTAEAGTMEYNNTFHLTNSDATRRHVVLAPNTTKVTAGAPYTNDGYIVMNIGGTDFKIMTTA